MALAVGGRWNSINKIKLKAKHNNDQEDNFWKLQVGRTGAAINNKVSYNTKGILKIEVEVKKLLQWKTLEKFKLPDWKLSEKWTHGTNVYFENLPKQLQGMTKFIEQQLYTNVANKIKFQAKYNKQEGIVRLGVKMKIEFD